VARDVSMYGLQAGGRAVRCRRSGVLFYDRLKSGKSKAGPENDVSKSSVRFQLTPQGQEHVEDWKVMVTWQSYTGYYVPVTKDQFAAVTGIP